MDQPNTRSVGDQTTDQTPYAIGDAADRLGMTSEAVRMRLKRGTLQGEKVNGRWVVYLDSTEHPTTHPTEPAPTTDQTPPKRSTEQPTERDQTRVVEVYETLVSSQREEITFLRDQLDHSRRELSTERERFDVIHREALHRIEALTAGIVIEPEHGTMPYDASPEAPGATDAGAMTPDAVHSRSRVSDAVRRLFGRPR